MGRTLNFGIILFASVIALHLPRVYSQVLIATTDDCIDKHLHCRDWKIYCKALVFSDYLRKTCPISCGYCQVVVLEDAPLSIAESLKIESEFLSKNHSKLNFDGSVFRGTIFEDLDLKNSSFNGATLRGVNFTNCNLNRATFKGASLNAVTFARTTCIDCSFDGAKLRAAEFKEIDLDRATFNGCDMRDVEFVDTELEKAIFNPRVCRGVDGDFCRALKSI